jgi:hypothetical protein
MVADMASQWNAGLLFCSLSGVKGIEVVSLVRSGMCFSEKCIDVQEILEQFQYLLMYVHLTQILFL